MQGNGKAPACEREPEGIDIKKLHEKFGFKKGMSEETEKFIEKFMNYKYPD